MLAFSPKEALGFCAEPFADGGGFTVSGLLLPHSTPEADRRMSAR
jgi:hypothetical protein